MLGFLLVLATIGGAPTFLGPVKCHAVVNVAVSVVLLLVAAESILYVIVQLIIVGSRDNRADLLACGHPVGLFAGFVTDGSSPAWEHDLAVYW